MYFSNRSFYSFPDICQRVGLLDYIHVFLLLKELSIATFNKVNHTLKISLCVRDLCHSRSTQGSTFLTLTRLSISNED